MSLSSLCFEIHDLKKIFQNKNYLDGEYYWTGKNQGSNYGIFFCSGCYFWVWSVLNFFLAYFHRSHVPTWASLHVQKLRVGSGFTSYWNNFLRLKHRVLPRETLRLSSNCRGRAVSGCLLFKISVVVVGGPKSTVWVLWSHPQGIILLTLYVSSVIDTGTI